jgi:hypothetical protein
VALVPFAVVTHNEGDKTITTPSKTESALILKAAPSQEAPLLQLRDSNGTPRVSFYPGSNGEVHHGLTLIEEGTPNVAPELNFFGKNGAWFIGMDVANAPGNKDFVLLGKRSQDRQSAFDMIYVKDNDSGGTEKAALVGFGVTPPITDKYNRWQFTAADADKELGTIGIRVGPEQMGHVLQVYDSGGADKVWLTSTYRWQAEVGLKFQASGTTANSTARVMGMLNSAGSAEYGWEYFEGTGLLSLRYFTGGIDILTLDTEGGLTLKAPKLAFFSGAAVSQPSGVPKTAEGVWNALKALNLIAA